MEQPSASIPLRLPIAIGKTLVISLGIMFFYIITIILAFFFQHNILIVTGINPAQISIVIVMVILFIPWGIIAWLLLRRFSKIGVLRLYPSHIVITGSDSQILKEYQANSILLITIQNNAYHFDFKDGYKFNVINLAMGAGYSDQMVAFLPFLLNFVYENNIMVKQGVII